jgi:hypothetical protein
MTTQIRTALFSAILFAIGFVLVAVPLSLGLRQATPMPDLVVLSPKLDAYVANPDAYDTVFIGTSRTFYHIVPDEVEAGAAEAGCPDWRVYNLGVFGLTGVEEDWLVEQVLAAGGPSLKRVVIEDPLPNARDLADVTTDRARYFHDPALLRAQVDTIASYPESLPKRVFRGGIMVLGTGFDLSGVGRGAALLFPPGVTPPPHTFDMAEDGFEALGSILTPDIEARRKDFEDHPEQFEAKLARYGAKTNEDVTARAAYLAERLDRLEARGVEAALFVSPDLAELGRTPRTGEAVRALPGNHTVLNFNRPDVYPDLFARDLWFDFSHFGETGARTLSREVGRTYCQQAGHQKETAVHAVR